MATQIAKSVGLANHSKHRPPQTSTDNANNQIHWTSRAKSVNVGFSLKAALLWP